MTLSSGDRFTAEVTILRNGTASVSVDNETISVGPVICQEGTQVQLKYLGDRNLSNMNINYAICLTQEAINPRAYDNYLNKIFDILTPEENPEIGSVTYLKIERVDEDGIGYATGGEDQFILGPTTAVEDDFLQVEVITNDCAKIIDSDLRGDDYEPRFWLLSGQHCKLPIESEEEHTTAVAEFDGDARVCYVKNLPVRIKGCDAKLGQKLDIEITGFESDVITGSVIETYDEVVRTSNPGHWARMQWLREANVEDPPLQSVATGFIGVDSDSLPEETERLKTALVGEAIRLCLTNKAVDSTESYPRAHVRGIQHWIEHKLKAIVGASDDPETGWLRDVLDEGDGPTLTFQGDVIKLSHGYYAIGPTRAIPVSDSTAVLVSGLPTEYFLEKGLNVQLRGLSRVVRNISKSELRDHNIRIQSRENYIGAEVSEYDEKYLDDFISRSELTEWQGNNDWESFAGESGFGFTWDDEPMKVKIGSDRNVSIWREPVEYGRDEFHLQIDSDDLVGLRLPNSKYKQFCLLLEAMVGSARTIEILETPEDEVVQLRCSFSPPRSQFRWLTAIGADWRGFENNQIQWLISKKAVGSVVDIFEQLPVQVFDES